MDRMDELVARLDRVEAELAMHRLVHDYCVGADHRDLQRWRSVWTQDAVWDTGPDRVYLGLDAICQAVEKQWQEFPIMQHATSNHVVVLDGDAAGGRCDVTVMVQLRDRRWVVGGGTYEDDYRRDDGVWRIARRRVRRPFDLAPLPPNIGQGDLELPTRQRPDQGGFSRPVG